MEFCANYIDVINIISGVGTFLSALIALFTLREVKKQRLSLYKPEILIKSFLISISKNPLFLDNNELLKYKTSIFNDHSINYDDIDFEVYPKYKVDNFGFGIAKSVNCTWEFDTKTAINQINKIIHPRYSLNLHDSIDVYFLRDSKNEDFHYSSNAMINKNQTDHISPINIQENYHYFSIPNIIIFTHYLFLIFDQNLTTKSVKNFNHYEFEEISFPKPTLNIEYADLNNKKYRTKINFKVTAVVTQVGEKINMNEDFAYLLFEIHQSKN